MKKHIWCAVAFALLSGCASTTSTSVNPVAGELVDITVTVNNIESSDGNLLIYLHDNAESYYSDDDFSEENIKYFKKVVVKPTMPSTQVIVSGVPAGKYAVSIVHDEDQDGTLDRMIFPFLGMPSEPYGLSNNAYSPLSKGAFEDALVELSKNKSLVTVELATHLSKTFDL